MKLSIIVAMAQNGVIGKNNQLPWRLPEDLKHFKQTTLGHPIIMGRKTYQSIGKPLPGRQNIVISKNRNFKAEGIEVTSSLEEALNLAKNDEEVFVIGGAGIYNLAYEKTQTLYITQIEKNIEGDTYFPHPDYLKDFQLIKQSEALISQSGLPYRFLVLSRKTRA